jgi:hypothetical protein
MTTTLGAVVVGNVQATTAEWDEAARPHPAEKQLQITVSFRKTCNTWF